MRTHTLKCWTDKFAEVRSGRKTFEFRRDDRGFAVGDVLDLRDFDPGSMMYSGQFELRRVTYILSSGFGMPDGFVVMSLETIECCGEPVHDGDPCGYILECCGKYRTPPTQPIVSASDRAEIKTSILYVETDGHDLLSIDNQLSASESSRNGLRRTPKATPCDLIVGPSGQVFHLDLTDLLLNCINVESAAGSHIILHGGSQGQSARKARKVDGRYPEGSPE